MKNNPIDLNNHLFAQIERLGDEDLKGEDLDREIARSKAMSQTAGVIVQNNKVVLDAAIASKDYGLGATTQQLLGKDDATS